MYTDYYNMYNQYYGLNDYNHSYGQNYNFRSTTNMMKADTSGEIITLNEALELIKKSVGDEKNDEMFYTEILEQAPTEKDKHILRAIRDDERKHNQILRNVYYRITGQMLPENRDSERNTSKEKYVENLEKALMGELGAVTKYRKIMGAMPDDETYTLLMSIMTDELRHASKYNFLIHNAK